MALVGTLCSYQWRLERLVGFPLCFHHVFAPWLVMSIMMIMFLSVCWGMCAYASLCISVSGVRYG